MRLAPLSTKEAQRVATVATFDILDTEPEADFDNLTLLARPVCHTPIATIGILDSAREWFKASLGIELRELALNDSFSAHALRGPQVLVIPDAAENSRFANLSLVDGEAGIRFFAGAPLITRSGSAIGTLSVMDRMPRIDFSSNNAPHYRR